MRFYHSIYYRLIISFIIWMSAVMGAATISAQSEPNNRDITQAPDIQDPNPQGLDIQTSDPQTPVENEQEKLAVQTLEARAVEVREAAEIRIENQMVEMTNLVEALARNLGQLHYLRTLCFGTSDQKWRDFASHMMDMEAKRNPSQKPVFIEAFNQGYYHEQTRYQSCNQNISVDAAALAENGRHLATMLGDPYRDN